VTTYREQYDRMKRRHDRFSERSADRSAQSLMDDAQAFFECCLHLRDWIENDEELPQRVRDAARPYVKGNRVLSLCHDIAIAAKHLIVDRPLAKDENPRLRPEHTMEQLPAESVYGDDDDDNFLPPGTLVQVISVRLMLDTDGGETVDALMFATECLEAWASFFELHGLT